MTRRAGARPLRAVSRDEIWADRYRALAARVRARARTAAPVLAGFSACVDHVHRMDAARIAALVDRAGATGPAGRVAAEVHRRIRQGHGGEIVELWPGGTDWVRALLGAPDQVQLGGSGPQASWALAVLGAPSVVPLADRGAEQLAVLHPEVRLCTATGTVTAGRLAAAHGGGAADGAYGRGGPGDPGGPGGSGGPGIHGGLGRPRVAKQPHSVLEFAAGTPVPGLPDGLPRSSRIILRFVDDGIERDEWFAARSGELARTAAAGLLSGMNGLPEGGTGSADRAWLTQVVRTWRDAGLPLLHLELAEFATVSALRSGCDEYAPLADSVGMSLSELAALAGPSARASPVTAAARFATAYHLERVCVHADGWVLAVHRGDPTEQRTALMTGSLLAAARAAHGEPTAELEPPAAAGYTADRPADGPLGDGLRADCVPAPHLCRPAATIGLGDTFVGGLLLARSLPPDGPPHRPPPSTTTDPPDLRPH
ncbi:ADP-dependent glucokinase/phosphofructokinase [Streptomyces javensis]|uniref:ADP-dependent glucokinase/phosphofructokinase n=1 Tax=Streptomyces javensis TaxID=114698 RepID=UPI0033C5F995